MFFKKVIYLYIIIILQIFGGSKKKETTDFQKEIKIIENSPQIQNPNPLVNINPVPNATPIPNKTSTSNNNNNNIIAKELEEEISTSQSSQNEINSEYLDEMNDNDICHRILYKGENIDISQIKVFKCFNHKMSRISFKYYILFNKFIFCDCK